MRAFRNLDGFTLAGFIKRARVIMREDHPSMPDVWKTDWDGICEDHWGVELAPFQAVEAILKREGFDID